MKTVLITGSNGGLGVCLARQLLEYGYFVILNYHLHHENLLSLTKLYPTQTFLLQGDVSQEEDVLKMKKECLNAHLEIDILINNAGIDNVSEVREKNEETFLKIFKVNTLSVFLMSQTFGGDINHRHGSIINISSDNSIDQYDPVTMEYDVSKSGVNILTYDFAKYYKDAKVNAIAFGWLDTPMNNFPNEMKKLLNFVPLTTAVKEIINLFETKETGKVIICR